MRTRFRYGVELIVVTLLFQVLLGRGFSDLLPFLLLLAFGAFWALACHSSAGRRIFSHCGFHGLVLRWKRGTYCRQHVRDPPICYHLLQVIVSFLTVYFY